MTPRRRSAIHDAMVQNAHRAIPTAPEKPAAVTRIYSAQQLPRLPADELAKLLHHLVKRGDAEMFVINSKPRFRRKAF